VKLQAVSLATTFEGGISGTSTRGLHELDVVPGSGTGDLAGLSGTFSIERSPDGRQTCAFDYQL